MSPKQLISRVGSGRTDRGTERQTVCGGSRHLPNVEVRRPTEICSRRGTPWTLRPPGRPTTARWAAGTDGSRRTSSRHRLLRASREPPTTADWPPSARLAGRRTPPPGSRPRARARKPPPEYPAFRCTARTVDRPAPGTRRRATVVPPRRRARRGAPASPRGRRAAGRRHSTGGRPHPGTHGGRAVRRGAGGDPPPQTSAGLRTVTALLPPGQQWADARSQAPAGLQEALQQSRRPAPPPTPPEPRAPAQRPSLVGNPSPDA